MNTQYLLQTARSKAVSDIVDTLSKDAKLKLGRAINGDTTIEAIEDYLIEDYKTTRDFVDERELYYLKYYEQRIRSDHS